jgi:hypothetical protein
MNAAHVLVVEDLMVQRVEIPTKMATSVGV